MVTTRQKIAQCVIARLDGDDFDRNFEYYRSLVHMGIGGFIIFGGVFKAVKNGLSRLQREAETPLFVCSDLEQGLGQQVRGGTLFPPAMAIARAIITGRNRDVVLLRRAVRIMAREALAAGINVMFAPVLDVSSNPDNPIVCTRSFSESPRTVAWFGAEFVRGLQREGVLACAKHFPGHGDTRSDSHRELPVIGSDLKRLQKVELYPFARAVRAGVRMTMAGHLKVPAVDRRNPASCSDRALQGLLRKKMGFRGLVITDAMNMGAVSGGKRNAEPLACFAAFRAGADILLHPSDPVNVIGYVTRRGKELLPRIEESFHRIIREKNRMMRQIGKRASVTSVGTHFGRKTAQMITRRSIRVHGKIRKVLDKPMVVIIDDDNSRAGSVFTAGVRKRYAGAGALYLDNTYRGGVRTVSGLLEGRTIFVGVFSKVSPWKGRVFSRKLHAMLRSAIACSQYSVVIGFCCPYIISGQTADVLIDAYSGQELSQEAAAELLCSA